MNVAQGKSRTDLELWTAIEALGDDLLDPDLPMSVLEDELRSAGEDPAALAKEGAEFLARLQEEHRLAWQVQARQRRMEMEQRLATNTSLLAMGRGQLLARLDELRRSPQLGAPVMTAFRKRMPEESTDDELRALLEDIEALRALNRADGEPESE